MKEKSLALPYIPQGGTFPPPCEALSDLSDAPGLLAFGADLSVETLTDAYQNGIFPWYSEGQPILWWSPDPRMVLYVDEFKIHRSLKKTLNRFLQDPTCAIRMNTAFSKVTHHCAMVTRKGQTGTWMLQEIQNAYQQMNHAGLAHSVEVWKKNQLVGGLYCTSIGKAVFGESMFSLESDASKIALCALVAFCKYNGVKLIDCQQNTSHLTSLGARPIKRDAFLSIITTACAFHCLNWKFDFLYWSHLANYSSTSHERY